MRSLLDRHTTLTIMNSYEPIDDLDPHMHRFLTKIAEPLRRHTS